MVILSDMPGTTGLLRSLARRFPGLVNGEQALELITQPVDIVHGFNISWEYPMLIAGEYAQRRGIPFVASPLAHLGTGPNDRVAKNSTMRHQRHMLSTATMLLTNTTLEAQGLQEMGIETARIGVAGPGLDVPQTVAPFPEEGRQYEPFVLFVGRTTYDKGVWHAVQALQLLRRQGSDLQLLLIGRQTEEFHRFCNELPPDDQQAVHHLGHVEESLKHAYLRQATALLLPSRTDSFGIVLLESWFHGRPVIAAEAGGIPAVVDDGRNGILVSFGDVEGLASAINLLYENQTLNHELGRNGRQKLLAQYTWEAITDKVLAAYQELLPGNE
jgi:glycosyltransferase involved in cell wall biosynthesis